MIKSKLSKYINQEKRKTVLFFDTHNLIYRTLFIGHFQDPDDDKFMFWKYLMANSIFTAIKQFEPDKVVFAIDSKYSWRKDIYSNYKGQRKAARTKSVVDFETFFPVMDSFLESLKKTFTNMYCIKVNKCEGDDIIAILTKNRFQDFSKIIISTDKDLHQLLMNKRVKIYDPIKRKFKEILNPKMDLELKIITGDPSDNIPKIKERCGKGTATKMLKDGLDIYLANDEIRKRYELNKRLIDFEFIPNDIEESILEEFDNYEIKKLDGYGVYNWLIENKIRKLRDDLQIYSPFLKAVE